MMAPAVVGGKRLSAAGSVPIDLTEPREHIPHERRVIPCIRIPRVPKANDDDLTRRYDRDQLRLVPSRVKGRR
jgi:hypothetical protein